MLWLISFRWIVVPLFLLYLWIHYRRLNILIVFSWWLRYILLLLLRHMWLLHMWLLYMLMLHVWLLHMWLIWIHLSIRLVTGWVQNEWCVWYVSNFLLEVIRYGDHIELQFLDERCEASWSYLECIARKTEIELLISSLATIILILSQIGFEF